MKRCFSRNIGFLIVLIIGSFHSWAQPCNANAGPDTSICLGATATIGGSPAGTGNGVITYSWAPGTNLSCTNCPNPVVTANSNQSYTLTIQDASGCTDTDVIQVTTDALPIANFTINNNNVCANIPVSFTNTSTGTGLSYSWNFGDPASGSANTSTATNPTHTFQAVGSGTQTFTVVLTVTNAAGCSANISQTVTVNQSPAPALLDPVTSFKNCGGGTYNMTVFDGSGASGNNYTIIWGDGSPNFSAGSFPGAGVQHTYATAEVFTMTYIVTGTNGCADSTLYNVANITNPAIGAANPGATTGCGPVTLCFPLNNYAANHSTTFYVVNYGDGSPLDTLPHPPPATICHTYSSSSCGQPGNAFVFRIKAINLCDSSEASISPIRVYTGPTANFTPAAQNNCVGSTVTFLNQTVAGFNSSCSASTMFQWNFGNGQTLTTATLTNPTTVYNAPGTYTVTLTTTNSCGSNTITRTVCIENPPVPDFTASPASACIPFTATMTDASNLANTCSITRTWSVIYNGAPCTPATAGFSFVGGTNASSVNPQIQFTQAGNYVVRLTLTNSCGSFFIDKPIVAQKPPQVTLVAPAAICEGTTTNPTATVIDCLEPTDTYSWSFTGGSPAAASTLVPGTITYATAGTYPITFSATNACGTTTQTVNFTVNPIPPALNAQVNSPVCQGQAANFTSNANPSTSYSWTGPNGFTAFTQNFTIPAATLTQAGTYTVTGSIAGCPGPSSSVSLTVLPIPVISVTPPSATICIGDSVNLTASGATSYTWSPATGLSATNIASVNASPPATQTYTISGSNGTCSGTTTATVTVNPLPIVNAGVDTTVCDQPFAFQLGATPAGGTWSGPNVSATGQFTPNGTGVFTLTYSFTNANGCSNSDQRVVTVIAPTQPDAGNDTTVCMNTPNITLVPSPTGGTWTGTNVTTGGVFSPITTGVNTLVYQFGSGACLLRDTVRITVNPLPIVNAGIDSTLCIDAADFTVSGTPNGGTWTGTGISVPSGTFSPAIAGAGTHTITYSVTDVNGCSAADTKNITINPLPVVNAGPDSTACNQPLPFQLGASPSGGIWSGPNISSSGLFNPNGTGVFTLTYTFTNANGCTNSDSRNLTIADPTTVNAGMDSAVCLNSTNLVLNPSPVGGTWSGTNVTTGGTFTPNTVGVFPLVYSLGAGTCLTRDTVVVTVNALPVVNAGSDFTRCIDAPTVALSGTPSGGVWTGNGLIAPTDFSPSLAGSGTHNLVYTFTDINGCVSSDNLNAVVNALPVVQAGNDTTLCDLPVPVTFTASPAGGIWSGGSITAGGVFTPSGAGNTTVTYTFTNANGCVNSDTKIITVVTPSIPNAGSDFAVCSDALNQVLNGTPVGGTWSGSFVTPAGIFDPSAAGTFSLVYSTGAGNCLLRDTLIATVHPLPVVNAGPNATFCFEDPAVTFAATPVGGTWSGNGITNTTTGDFDPSAATIGTNTIVYSFTEPATGCLQRDTLLAIVNPMPVANFTYNPIVCIGNAHTYTNTSSLGTTYDWDFGDGNTSNIFQPNHTYLQDGFFDIQLIATTNQGCKDTIIQAIEVRVPPVAQFTAIPDSACGPVTTTFNDASTGPNLTYSWNYGNGITSTDPIPLTQTYLAGIIADTTYTVVLTLSNSCGVDVDSAVIQVMPVPVAVFGTSTNNLCSPTLMNFVNNSYGLPDDYYWDFGDGTTSDTAATAFTHGFWPGVNDTTYTINLIVSNECGSDTISHFVIIHPIVVNAFFNLDDPDGCAPHTVQLTQFSQGATFSSWDFGDGNLSNQQNPSHTFTQPGTYNVSLFVNDGCGYDTMTQTVTVFPSPVVDFLAQPDSVCINETFAFSNLSVGIASCSWDFGDGNNSILTNPSHAYSSSGTYNVTLNAISQTNGCPASITHPVIVSVNPVANFTATPINGCMPLDVQFTNTSSQYQFQTWDFDDGNFSIANSPNHTFTAAGSYTVQLHVENINGCSDTLEQIINVYPLPVAAFTIDDTTICTLPQTAQFTNNSTGALGYEWDFGNGQTSNLTSPSSVYNNLGTYQIELIAFNSYGCTDTVRHSLTAYPSATATINYLPSDICLGQTITLNATTTLTDSLVWSLGDGTYSSNNPITHTYINAGTYPISLIAYGDGGCHDTTTTAVPQVVLQSPIAGFTYENVGDPVNGTIQFTNTSQFADTYFWEFGNDSTSTETNPETWYDQDGFYDVMLIASNPNGCIDTAISTIEVELYFGLFIPNAMSPGHSNFEVANFIPKGVGLKTFELLIYDDWGNLIWSTTALDSDGRPTEYWDGTYLGEPVQQDAYVWKVTATFENELPWEGKEYKNGILKRSGTVTVIR